MHKHTSTHVYQKREIHMQSELSPKIAKNKEIQELALNRWFWDTEKSHTSVQLTAGMTVPLTFQLQPMSIWVLFLF